MSTSLTGDNAIPKTVLAAYRKAAATLAVEKPSCHLTWPLLAGIGKVETDHGRSWGAKARITAKGDVVPTILGPVLDGRYSAATLLDTDHGAYDHSRKYDRAVGPMQFVPSTWREYGRDGNGDRKADPNNIWDASLGAASYLCANNRDLANAADRRAAILAYNPSNAYARSVLAWAAVYQRAVTSGPALVSVPDPVVLGAGGELGEGPFGDFGTTGDSASFEDAGYPPNDSGDLTPPIIGPSPADTITPSKQPVAKPTVGTKKPKPKPAATPKPTPSPSTTPACVAPGVALVSKAPITAVAVDKDHDGTNDALRVTTTVNATKAGPYTFEIRLLDADQYLITSALHTVHLAAGKQDLIDELSGQAIGDAGASGPATVQVTARKAAAPRSCAVVLPTKASAVDIDPSSYDGWTVNLARLQQRLADDIAAGLIKDDAATTLPASLAASSPDLTGFLADLGDTTTIDPAEQKRLASLAQRLIDQDAASPSPSSTMSPSPMPMASSTPTPTPTPTPSESLAPSPSLTPTPSPSG